MLVLDMGNCKKLIGQSFQRKSLGSRVSDNDDVFSGQRNMLFMEPKPLAQKSLDAIPADGIPHTL